jgi:hypothetical protein
MSEKKKKRFGNGTSTRSLFPEEDAVIYIGK